MSQHNKPHAASERQQVWIGVGLRSQVETVGSLATVGYDGGTGDGTD